ncbi:MAG TPA: lasso RiPP family leader peptide-containing protein [Thermoanaerobaculia bacterium]|nr:lasso RiPP family leader peptide-containing protein [Thermoanaerobaculia bacterium]
MDQKTAPVPQEARTAERKVYTSPTLTDFGSFAEITQGSVGTSGADGGIYS